MSRRRYFRRQDGTSVDGSGVHANSELSLPFSQKSKIEVKKMNWRRSVDVYVTGQGGNYLSSISVQFEGTNPDASDTSLYL